MTKAKKEGKPKGKGKENEDSGNENSKWSKADEALLIHTLTEQKADGHWGDNNPKATTWQACLTALAGSEKESGGAPKGVTVLKSRWQKVRHSYVYVCAYLTSNYTVQLKREYEIIKGLRNLSGVGWNDVTKRVKAEPSVWDAYCKVRLSHIYAGLHCFPHLPPPLESPQGESLSQEGLPTL